MIFMTPCNWCCGRAYLMEVGSWQGQVGDPRCSILQMDIALWVPFRASGPFCGISFSRYCIWYVWYAWSFLPGFIYGWESGHSQSLGVHPTIALQPSIPTWNTTEVRISQYFIPDNRNCGSSWQDFGKVSHRLEAYTGSLDGQPARHSVTVTASFVPLLTVSKYKITNCHLQL